MEASKVLKDRILKVIKSEINLTLVCYLASEAHYSNSEVDQFETTATEEQVAELCVVVLKNSSIYGPVLKKWLNLQDLTRNTNFDSYSQVMSLKRVVDSMSISTSPREQLFLAFRDFLKSDEY